MPVSCNCHGLTCSICSPDYKPIKTGPNLGNTMNHEYRYGSMKPLHIPLDDGDITAMEQQKQEPGLKFDAGKPQLSMLPIEALEEITKVLEFGAKKYGRNNWRKGMSWSRLLDAALRHLFKWAFNSPTDEETGLSHLAHAGCCILFLLTYEVSSLGTDDLGE